MSYLVAFIATRWGSELGGINVFNTGLVKGTARQLSKGSICLCFVESLPAKGLGDPQVLYRTHTNEPEGIAREIHSFCGSDLPPREVLVVGHDIKTGSLAIECVAHLRRMPHRSRTWSAVVCHMDYAAYLREKGQSLDRVAERSAEQRSLVQSADSAFGVGPLLTNAFQVARRQEFTTRSAVQMLVPGAPRIPPTPQDDGGQLRFFIAGRLGQEDDPIKNSYVSIEALLRAYENARSVDPAGRWSQRGVLYAYGVDPVTDVDVLARLSSQARDDSLFELEAIPFTTDQESMYARLSSSHVALMPSWHEGFGLVGWEALCAGVPLICSRQSGLAQLLMDLRQRVPSMPLESVEFVQVAGGSRPGAPSGIDKDRLAAALLKCVADYPAKKASALKLARFLCARYSWESCANNLLKEVGWSSPASTSWQSRKAAAEQDEDDGVESRTIRLALEVCARGTVYRDWAVLCSAFNVVSDRGKSAGVAESASLMRILQQLAAGVQSALPALADQTLQSAVPCLRDSGVLDVCWRYMAAAASCARNVRKFCELLSGPLMEVVASDSFLRRELLHYLCKFVDEIRTTSSDLVSNFLEPVQRHLEADSALQLRLARLSACFPGMEGTLNASKDLERFEQERQRCNRVLGRQHDIGLLLNEEPALAPTLLALWGIRRDLGPHSVAQIVDFVAEYDRQVPISWRGDKRFAAAITVTGVPSSHVLQVLDAMSTDEEEAVRWAALDLAFSPTLRARLGWGLECDGAHNLPDARMLTSVLGSIVDKCVATDGGHPWLAREFLIRFRREHDGSLAGRRLSRFSVTDFPISRQVFGPQLASVEQKLQSIGHPEVLEQLEKTQRVLKRVALVLPQIAPHPRSETRASPTSTPPLGLGVLATHLASLGHDVQIADCHRYPELHDRVVGLADTFDLIGFNTVLSTVRSAYAFLSEVRAASERPVLVVGGPAASLGSWRFAALTDDERRSWDFAVTGDAVDPLEMVVRALGQQGPWPVSEHVIPNDESALVASRDTESHADESRKSRTSWTGVVIDRRHYRAPNGVGYEPALTRAHTESLHEAHVVMSRGCDWNCTFCTERVDLGGGEVRRDVASVLGEVRHLTALHGNVRIQFIDDNLLPQIAAPRNISRVAQAGVHDWSVAFVTGLTELRQATGGNLAWRGIFRVEDFLLYDAKIFDGRLPELLASAGCTMLAFGLETGDSERRRRLKAGTSYSNEDVTSLLGRLSARGIATKAYFILGGPGETAASTRGTIAFALNCGVSLAYFALYKEFVGGVSQLRREGPHQRVKAEKYLSYGELASDWDQALAGSSDRIKRIGSVSDEQRQCYDELARQGFRFRDLVKYSDYHSASGASREMLEKATWGAPDEYFSLVQAAYFDFYLRRKFVNDYSLLVAAGY